MIVAVSTEEGKMKPCKEDAIKEIKQIIEAHPELADVPIANDGENDFTLTQIISEIENETPAGIKMIANYCEN